MKSGKWKSVYDMSGKTGVPESTLHRIIKAKETRDYLPGQVSKKVSWRDIDRTRPLKDNPETRKQILKIRSEGNGNFLIWHHYKI